MQNKGTVTIANTTPMHIAEKTPGPCDLLP